MGRKNYLVEELSEEEEKYIICAINKAFFNAIRKLTEDKNIRKYSIDDENIENKLPNKEDSYFDVILDIDSWNIDIPLSKKQQNICVKKLESLVEKFGIQKYIKTLAYSEKLVFFLLDICCFSLNKTAFLIESDWKTIKRRYISANNKIGEARLKYERR